MNKIYVMFRRSYILLNIILLLLLLTLFRSESPVLLTISNYVSLIMLIIGFILLFSLWRNYSMFLSRSTYSIYIFWMIMLFWFFIIPLSYNSFNFNQTIFYQGMFQDYRYLLLATLPFIFISDYTKQYFDKIFINVGYVAFILGIIGIFVADKSLVAVSDRDNTWTMSYYFWWIVSMVFPYLFLTYFYLKKNRLGLLLIIIQFIFSIIFLKRAGFLNGILIIIFALFFSKKKTNFVWGIIILLLIIFISNFIFGEYISLLINRFSSDANNLKNWDRAHEFEAFLLKAKPTELFTGFGANNYIKMEYIGENRTVNALHIGAYNILYKGGVLYVSFVLYLFYNIISLYKYINYNIEIKIGFIIGLVYIISNSYEQSWSYLPTIFFVLLPIYRAIYLKDNIIDSFRKKNNKYKTVNY